MTVGCRRKHGLPLVMDDKGKVAKKKNLQVMMMLKTMMMVLVVVGMTMMMHGYRSQTETLYCIS